MRPEMTSERNPGKNARRYVVRTPTQDLWDSYQLAFDYLNEALFQDRLPQCILNFATHGRSQAFFSPARWEKAASQIDSQIDGQNEQAKTAHEISLNPLLLDEPTETILAWLTRLMAQLWQWELGDYRPQQQGYYNREFTEKMEHLGLPCSDDGTPEGKKTGFKMRHWIAPNGKFKAALEAMPRDYFPWKGGKRQTPPTTRTIQKYQCPTCGTHIMAMRPISAICNTKACDTPFELCE